MAGGPSLMPTLGVNCFTPHCCLCWAGGDGGGCASWSSAPQTPTVEKGPLPWEETCHLPCVRPAGPAFRVTPQYNSLGLRVPL